MATSIVVATRYGTHGLTIYTTRVHRKGAVQKAFAGEIGHHVGGCVKANVRKGMSAEAIRRAFADCAKGYKGAHFAVRGSQ